MRHFLTCMPHDVIRKMLLPRKRFSANFTSKRRIVRMRSHVVCKVLFSGIFFPANRAMMGGFPGVPHNVVHKMFFSRERLLAYFTPKENLSIVDIKYTYNK